MRDVVPILERERARYYPREIPLTPLNEHVAEFYENSELCGKYAVSYHGICKVVIIGQILDEKCHTGLLLFPPKRVLYRRFMAVYGSGRFFTVSVGDGERVVRNGCFEFVGLGMNCSIVRCA